MQINRYNNRQSKRRLKKAAVAEAKQRIAKIDPPAITVSDIFLELERWPKPEKSESSKFKKEKPLKQGSTVGGKQKLSRGCIPLI